MRITRPLCSATVLQADSRWHYTAHQQSMLPAASSLCDRPFVSSGPPPLQVLTIALFCGAVPFGWIIELCFLIQFSGLNYMIYVKHWSNWAIWYFVLNRNGKVLMLAQRTFIPVKPRALFELKTALLHKTFCCVFVMNIDHAVAVVRWVGCFNQILIFFYFKENFSPFLSCPPEVLLSSLSR